ncbi:MAG TPA: HPP family protein [Gemmatimonadaceae bacterium]|nr:HPP family protein [Gemmatimonadaceae bacterium]
MNESSNAQDPHGLWSPITAAVVTAVPALAALASGQVLLFPSLGPSAVMQAHSPNHESSRFYNVVVSHVVGLAAADLCVFAFGVAHTPSVFQAHAVSGGRAAAAVLAILIGTAVELALHASHPPAASTTLLAALGSFRPTVHDTVLVVGGVLIVATAGEIARRVRLGAREHRAARAADGSARSV